MVPPIPVTGARPRRLLIELALAPGELVRSGREPSRVWLK